MKSSLSVYFIMGSQNCAQPLETLERALQAGISCFQFREKGAGALTGDAYVLFAQTCQQLCKQYNVPFIVNDDVALALALDADGIHVGQNDPAIHTFRECAQRKIIGVSVHNETQLEEAVRGGADYVGIGPIYPTTSKDDAEPPAGPRFLRRARTLYPHLPIVGIGGIHEQNAHIVRQNGADGVAVISAICQSNDIDATIAQLRQEVLR